MYAIVCTTAYLAALHIIIIDTIRLNVYTSTTVVHKNLFKYGDHVIQR
jgi:hypothetical protein